MNKKKITGILVVIGVLVGTYLYVNRGAQQPRCEEGFRFVPSSGQCEPVEKPSTTEIDFSKVKVRVPDSSVEIQLEKNDKEGIYTGVLSDTVNPSMGVSVSLNTADIVKYSDNLVLVPYLFNSGGTGQFVYVGLFDSTNNSHLDSVFIGDRIDITDIKANESIVRAVYKTRLDTEGFATTPSIPAQTVFEVKENKIIQVMRLQNADYSVVEIKSPVPGVAVVDLLHIKGAIPGSWYFEASAHFKILDENLKEIAVGSIQALSDWMTTQRVPFELSIPLETLNYKGKATIIIESENVQGDEEGEYSIKRISIPVIFK
jgi:hypothetical protein